MKTGLVLEGGALRTIFSAGVCDGLLAGGVMTDYVIGVSAGAAYGVSYISGQQGRNLEVATRFAPDKRYMGVGNLLRRDNRSYFGLDFTFRRIPEELVPFDYEAFAAWPGEMEAVVTNLNTGKADYLTVPRDAQGSSLLLQARVQSTTSTPSASSKEAVSDRISVVISTSFSPLLDFFIMITGEWNRSSTILAYSADAFGE